MSKAEEKILLSLDTGEYIIDKKVLKFMQKDSKIILDIFYSVIEDITEYQLIEEVDDNVS